VPATNFTVTGIISGASPTASLTKAGAGTLVLAAANTFQGSTTVSAGTLTLGNVGSLASTAVTVNVSNTSGANLTLDNANGFAAVGPFNVIDRLPDSTPLTLYGGTLNYLGNNTAGAASTETFGVLNLTGGHASINTTNGNATNASVIITSAGL